MVRRLTRTAGLALGVSALLVATAAPSVGATPERAQEAPYKSLVCNAGGFTGVLNVYSTARSGKVSLRYKIQKGSNSGGNKGDVDVTDTGVLPAKKLSTSKAIQDGKEHDLGGVYNRGSGTLYVTFTFDKSGALDPSCSVSKDFGPRY